MSYERCYLGTPTTCDAFVAEGLISQQPQQMLLGQLPGAPVPQAPAALPLAATLEVTREGWVPRPLSVERHTCCYRRGLRDQVPKHGGGRSPKDPPRQGEGSAAAARLELRPVPPTQGRTVGKLRHRITVRDQSGFTLIELLVVLIILAVLLAISVSAYFGFKDRAQQRTAASNIRSAIPDAEAYFLDTGTYTGMNFAALRAIDRGVSGAIQTVTVTPTTYCISAKVGSWWAHVTGPGGAGVISKEKADAC